MIDEIARNDEQRTARILETIELRSIPASVLKLSRNHDDLWSVDASQSVFAESKAAR